MSRTPAKERVKLSLDTTEMLNVQFNQKIAERKQKCLDELWRRHEQQLDIKCRQLSEEYEVCLSWVKRSFKSGIRMFIPGDGRRPYLTEELEGILEDVIGQFSEMQMPLLNKEIREIARALRSTFIPNPDLPSNTWYDFHFLKRHPTIRQGLGHLVDPARLKVDDANRLINSQQELQSVFERRNIKVKNLYAADETSWSWQLLNKRKVSSCIDYSKLIIL